MLKKIPIEAYVVVAMAVIFFFVIVRGSFVNEETAIRALETQGFSEIKVTDHAWFAIGFRGGDKNDAARFTATAKNPAGKQVTVYVFAGWPFKGATVRSL